LQKLLSGMLDKEWDAVIKEDIDVLVSKIMEKFAENNGQESNYSYDHKKVLKIFFRWLKLGSREFNEVGDPDETRKVKLGKIRDKIVREDLITEEDKEKLLKACSGNVRDRQGTAKRLKESTKKEWQILPTSMTLILTSR